MEFFKVSRGRAGTLSSNQKEKVLLSFVGILSKGYSREDPGSLGAVLIIGAVGGVLSRSLIYL